MVVHAVLNSKTEYMFATDAEIVPCSSIEEAINCADLYGKGSVYILQGVLKRSYVYLCDVYIDKKVKQKLYKEVKHNLYHLEGGDE